MICSRWTNDCERCSSCARDVQPRITSAFQRGQGSKRGDNCHFGWETDADRAVAYSRVIHPDQGVFSTKHHASLTGNMAEFEVTCIKKAKEDAKILAARTIMPELPSGEAGVFRGRSVNIHGDTRPSIIIHVHGKVPLSKTRLGPTSLAASRPCAAPNGTDEGVVLQEEHFAVL